jgi:ornithine cyclodeaminase/alanine dehydrogenase-like protein (mu-crystallin family)
MSIKWIAEADVSEVISLPEAINVVREALIDPTSISAPKAMANWEEGSLHALVASRLSAGVGGMKTWVNTTKGATALYELFDTDEGRLLAVIEAGALGMLRTASVAAVATHLLAPADATQVALIGSGRQAYLQLAAVAAVRTVKQVHVWSPNEAHRTSFAKTASALFGLNVIASESLDEALAGAHIAVTVTRAIDPFISAHAISQIAHVNAMGAILPSAAELTSEAIASFDTIITDDLAALAHVELAGRSSVSLSEALVQTVPPKGRTLFKSVGLAAADLAVAHAVFLRCSDRGLDISDPTPTLPRWA